MEVTLYFILNTILPIIATAAAFVTGFVMMVQFASLALNFFSNIWE